MEVADHLLDNDEEDKLNNFIRDMPVSVHRRTSESLLWAFWSGTHTLTTNQQITEKIKSVLKHYNPKNLTSLDHVLIQFWSPITIGTRCFLVTSDQPFGLTHLDEGLLKYRKHCLEYKFSVDGEEQLLGIPGRVFRQKWHQCIPDVGYYSSKEYPQLKSALTCGISASSAFPVFHTPFQDCVGVIEFVTNTDFRTFSTMCYSFLQLLLKEADLKSSLCRCLISWTLYEGFRYTLNEICEGLKVVCTTHRLPLAQMWVPCRHSMGQILHLQRAASYVGHDNNLLVGFSRFSMQNDFQKGQGVVGRAYFSRKPYFCRDITQFSLTEYPLLPGARHFRLTGCFAICLQSIYTGEVDYILEFFLNPENTYGEDPSTFLCSVFETMKQNFPSCKFASGEEFRMELLIEVIKPHMNQDPASFHCQSTRSSSRPGVLHNGQETMQPHSSYQQQIVEVDDLNNGRNVVINAEGNNTHVSCSDEANSWSDEVEVIEPDMHQQPGSFPNSSNVDQNSILVSCSEEARVNQEPASQCQGTRSPPGPDNGQETVQPHSSNQPNVVNAEQNNILVSCSDEANSITSKEIRKKLGKTLEDVAQNYEGEPNSWSDEVEIIEPGMQQKLGSFPHSSNQKLIAEVDDINNGRNVVNAEQNNILVSCLDEAHVNQEPASFQCQSTRSPLGLGVLHNGQEMQPHSPNQQLIVDVDDINNGRNVVNGEQNNILVSCLDEARMNQELVSLQCQSTRSPLGPGVLHNGQETMQPHLSNQHVRVEVDYISNGRNVVNGEQNNIPISCSDEANSIIGKEVGKHFGKNLDDVAQNYDGGKSMFKRTHKKNGISRLPRVKRNKVNGSPFSRQPPCSDSSAGRFVASVAPKTPLVVTPSEGRTITIIATYGEDNIKFQLPFSSRMVELKERVSKRLKLNFESYKIKYTDDDEDQILIACDKDLQDCMSAFNSLGMNTIKLLIEPINKISPST